MLTFREFLLIFLPSSFICSFSQVAKDFKYKALTSRTKLGMYNPIKNYPDINLQTKKKNSLSIHNGNLPIDMYRSVEGSR